MVAIRPKVSFLSCRGRLMRPHPQNALHATFPGSTFERFSSYRAYLRSPVRISAPLSVRSAKSRVVVAGEAPVIVLYLLAFRPPLNPLGPSRNKRRSAFCCLSLIWSRSRSSNFVLAIRNSTCSMVRRCASNAISANHASHSVASIFLLALSRSS